MNIGGRKIINARLFIFSESFINPLMNILIWRQTVVFNSFILSLFNRIVFSHRDCGQHIDILYFDAIYNGWISFNVKLGFQISLWVIHKFYGVFNQSVVRWFHFINLSFVVEILNEKAIVLNSGCSDVPTGSFERMSYFPEFTPILLIECCRYLLDQR
jgi:hypothetical protein